MEIWECLKRKEDSSIQKGNRELVHDSPTEVDVKSPEGHRAVPKVGIPNLWFNAPENL